MQVHLVAIGTHGDVLPIIALASALRRRGHTVALAAPAPFAPLAERAGIPFEGLGSPEDYARFTAEPDLWRPWRGVEPLFSYVSDLTEPTYRWLEGRWRRGAGVVVGSTLSLGARVAQERLDLPLATVHVMPFFMESRIDSPVLPGLPLPRFLPARFRHWVGLGADKYVIGPAALPRLNAFRAGLGLPPVRRLRHWWNLAPRLILMFPDWFTPPQTDWPQQAVQVGFPLVDRFGDTDRLDPALTAFLEAGAPPLVFTYGSAMRQGRAFFETAIALCRRMGRRGVLLAPQADQIPPDLPPEVIHLPYVPLSALLPRAAALIHHGGVGTVAQALAAGVPQLIVPVAFDHFDEGARVRRLGLGTTLRQGRFTPARAERHLRRLLGSPRVARALAVAKARMAGEDGIARACEAIERMAPAESEAAPGSRAG
ncbi:glycosyltransferase [Methylobacterium planeticum]|uniref:Glycosyltransferase n=1 Tax=Methylobacterium planeticum TaxID=2615211 RepID=A0A6N6MX55_9HYPH|nr:nucleotide disphospho-sugar-binding domain-containing protein [Methylobacterium planeticum]KAB1075306.1 glycosyltransferase [Methylobacterium planeticum]